MVTLFTWRAPFSKSTRPQVKLEGLRDRLNSDGFFLKKKKNLKNQIHKLVMQGCYTQPHSKQRCGYHPHPGQV
jgi:hypothetical protein